MAEELPKQAPNKTNDNLDQINGDVDSLYQQYIKPIEAIRSKFRPSYQINDYTTETKTMLIKGGESFTTTPLESRAHAFYRMIGLPVVSPNKGYYNSGFGFSLEKNSRKNRDKINASYYEAKELANFVYEREKSVIKFENFFKTTIEELKTIVYCLLSRESFPFAVTSPDSTDHLKIDKQSIKIDSRDLSLFLINNLDSQDQISEYVNLYQTVFHPIKPFIVDPRIAETVSPQENLICVPFIGDKSKTAIEKDVYIKTPVIQDIIEQRLGDPDLNSGFLKNLENLLSGNKDNKATTDIDYEVLVTTVSGLLENAEVTDEIKNFTQDLIKGVSNVQFKETLKITKTVKVLVKTLIESQKNLDFINSTISWVPVPGTSGPGYSEGWKLSEFYKGVQLKVLFKINDLKLKKIAAETENPKKPESGISSSPFVRNDHSQKPKDYDKELNKLKSETAQLAKKGYKSLRNIEIIKGEVSGLGLVDVLAMYYGLWAMSTENLLYLIDDESVARMIAYYPSYESLPVVADRKSKSATSTEVLKALKELESKVYFMLDFADKYYEESLQIKESKDSGG